MTLQPASPPSRGLRKPNSLRQPTLAAALTLATLPLPQLAFADDNPNPQLNAVVVEGQAVKGQNPLGNADSPYKAELMESSKFARPVAETPKSIQIITKEAIKDSGATDLKDVIRVQPGITISTGEGGNAFGDRFIIRGFEARNDVFIDGLRDPGVTSRETFAVEQIEVSKGPSSSFAGRGTTGGAINNVTKKPGAVDFTTLEVGVGTDHKTRTTLDVNRQLTDDTAVRVNALYSDRDVPGRDGAEQQRQGLAVAVDQRINTNLKLSADYYYFRSDEIPDGGVPWDSAAGKPVSGRRFYGQNGRDFLNNGADILTFGVDYNLGDGARLENRTRYGVTTNRYIVTIPGLGVVNGAGACVAGTNVGVGTPGVCVRANSQNRNQQNTYIGNQTNWIKEFDWGTIKHHVVAGVEFSREEAENIPYVDSLRTPNAGDPLNPNNNAWLQQGGRYTPSSNITTIRANTLSAYVLDTAKLNSTWEVFSGLRYDTFDYAYYTGPNDYQGTSRGGYKDGFLNGHVGVTYAPWINGNVYATYSTSSNASGEQLDATACDYGGLCGSNVKPERNRSIEVGTKWQLVDKRLLLTAALFDITKSNVLSQLSPGVFTQVGELQVRGVEVGVGGKINYDWDINAGLALLDTEIVKSDTPSEVGKSFPNTAETSANVQTRYRLDDHWAIGGTVTYKGKISGGTPNGAVTNNSLDASTVWDAMAEYTVSKDLKFRLNILNLFDTEYYTALYRSGSPFTYVGEGRSATLTLIKDF